MIPWYWGYQAVHACYDLLCTTPLLLDGGSSVNVANPPLIDTPAGGLVPDDYEPPRERKICRQKVTITALATRRIPAAGGRVVFAKGNVGGCILRTASWCLFCCALFLDGGSHRICRFRFVGHYTFGSFFSRHAVRFPM